MEVVATTMPAGRADSRAAEPVERVVRSVTRAVVVAAQLLPSKDQLAAVVVATTEPPTSRVSSSAPVVVQVAVWTNETITGKMEATVGASS